MPFALKILKAASVTAGSSTTYTVATPATSAIVSNIRLSNQGGSGTATVDVRVKDNSGASPVLVGHIVVPFQGQAVFDTELTLGLSQLVEVVVTQNNVDCLICGVERL